jgi:hypothetical protein
VFGTQERAELTRELVADMEESESPGWAAAWKAELAKRHATKLVRANRSHGTKFALG